MSLAATAPAFRPLPLLAGLLGFLGSGCGVTNIPTYAEQAKVEGTENRMAVARGDYIEAVRAYNTELKTYPGLIWARLLYANNKPMEEFSVAEDVRRNPQVRF